MLLQRGLLKAGFIPSRGQRELRELTGRRKSLAEECGRELRRLRQIGEISHKLQALASV